MAPAQPPCRAAGQAQPMASAQCQRGQRGSGWGCDCGGASAVRGGARDTTALMPKKVDAATANLAGKPDNRTAPYTVPMKAVPRQCGTAGTRPSSTAASVLDRGVHGCSRAPVPLCALPRPGSAVQPLRSWQSLLWPAVPTLGARRRSARERASVPTVSPRPAGPRQAVAALAPTVPCWR